MATPQSTTGSASIRSSAQLHGLSVANYQPSKNSTEIVWWRRRTQSRTMNSIQRIIWSNIYHPKSAIVPWSLEPTAHYIVFTTPLFAHWMNADFSRLCTAQCLFLGSHPCSYIFSLSSFYTTDLVKFHYVCESPCIYMTIKEYLSIYLSMRIKKQCCKMS